MLPIRPNKKFSNKYDSLFKITRIINFYITELELSKDWFYYNIFNNYLFRPRINDLLPR